MLRIDFYVYHRQTHECAGHHQTLTFEYFLLRKVRSAPCIIAIGVVIHPGARKCPGGPYATNTLPGVYPEFPGGPKD